MDKKIPDRVMRIERFLSKNQVIAVCIVLVDLLLFAIINYFLNGLNYIPDMIRDLDHPLRYWGPKNCLPSPYLISVNPSLYAVMYIGYIIACIVIDITLALKMKIAFDENGVNINQKGDQRFATLEEIKEQYKEIDDKDTRYPGMGGTIVSRMGNKLYIERTPTNTLYIGMTRSGKDQIYNIPGLDVISRAENQMSIIANDPKLEAYKASKIVLEDRGYDVYLLNWADPLHSAGFNPLDLIVKAWVSGDIAGAELLAQTYAYSIFNPDDPACNDKFWDSADASILNALIIAHIEDMTMADSLENRRNRIIHKERQEKYAKLKEEEKKEAGEKYREAISRGEDIYSSNKILYIPDDIVYIESNKNIRKLSMATIVYTFTELVRIRDEENEDITALDLFFNRRPGFNRAKLRYATAEVSGDRTKGSIFATMLEKLAPFTNTNVAKMMAESSFDIKDIAYGKKPIAVFMSVPDYDKSLHFLSTVFVRQANFIFSKEATMSKAGQIPRHVKFILNECGNMPAIENLEGQITVSLGRNMSYDLYIQDYQQLYDKYEKNEKTITNNCANHVYILSNDFDTAEAFSKKLGNETIIETQRSGQRFSLHKHFVESPTEKRIIDANQLMELLPGETVIKRVMVREDLDGNKVRPRPIFNSIEKGNYFLYAYEYLDTFPNPDTVDPKELIKEDRSYIDIEDRLWNVMTSFRMIEIAEKEYEKRHGKISFSSLVKMENPPEKNTKKKEKAAKIPEKLKDLPNKDEVLEIASEMLGTGIDENIKIEDFIKQINGSDINKVNKQALISLIQIGKK